MNEGRDVQETSGENSKMRDESEGSKETRGEGDIAEGRRRGEDK